MMIGCWDQHVSLPGAAWTVRFLGGFLFLLACGGLSFSPELRCLGVRDLHLQAAALWALMDLQLPSLLISEDMVYSFSLLLLD